MREIKFRAWVTSGLGLIEEYFMSYNITDINFAQGGPKDSNIRLGNPVKLRINNDPTKGFGMQLDSKEPVILMQYTGLKDKNGVEIYEGDIAKGIMAAGAGMQRRPGKECLFEVSGWLDGWGYRYCLRKITRLTGDYRSYPNFKELEVIGNIHENPELLKS